MAETDKSIPEGIQAVWNNLSLQMQGHLKAFGFESEPNLSSSDFTPEKWRKLSPQMQGRIKARKSMEEEIEKRRKESWKKLMTDY